MTLKSEKPLLFVYQAFWAHEHNYERFWPAYNYTIMKGSEEEPYVEPRATVHITTGSAVRKHYISYEIMS